MILDFCMETELVIVLRLCRLQPSCYGEIVCQTVKDRNGKQAESSKNIATVPIISDRYKGESP